MQGNQLQLLQWRQPAVTTLLRFKHDRHSRMQSKIVTLDIFSRVPNLVNRGYFFRRDYLPHPLLLPQTKSNKIRSCSRNQRLHLLISLGHGNFFDHSVLCRAHSSPFQA